MKKKRIPIDPDIQLAAENYVGNCLTILANHGDGPVDDFNFEETVYKVAEYPQRIRNMRKKS